MTTNEPPDIAQAAVATGVKKAHLSWDKTLVGSFLAGAYIAFGALVDRLQLTRIDNAPLSFGGGIHYCLGAPLARLEAQLGLPALARRIPRLALSGTPERRDSLSIKGFTQLPVDTQ